MNFFVRLVKQREFVIFVIVAAVFIFMIFASPIFLTSGNMLALLLSLSIEGIIAVGMVNLMVSGGFDLSVGSILGFAGVIVAMAMRAGIPVFLALLITLAAGIAIGLWNGIIVSKLKINPFVTTLASLSIFRGLTFIMTKGRNISGLPATFKTIGQARVGGIQLPIIYAALIIIFGDILLRNSRFLRQNYYIGGNEKAARLSGINVDRMLIVNYVITALLATFAGVVFTSRMGSSSCQAGTGWELRVITAVILGGASLRGGAGTVFGAFLGVFLMALISNALTLLGVDIYWQQFVVGVVLITAVIADTLGRSRTMRMTTKKEEPS
ncbi:MAG: ABC transporter permease [Spirochaetales bacterium]|nr:MAG: ABC transporter permease [Spirochaetales bacterium]